MEAPLFRSASASPYGLRSSRTELCPLKPSTSQGVGQIKLPKWAKPSCQNHLSVSGPSFTPPESLEGQIKLSIEFLGRGQVARAGTVPRGAQEVARPT